MFLGHIIDAYSFVLQAQPVPQPATAKHVVGAPAIPVIYFVICVNNVPDVYPTPSVLYQYDMFSDTIKIFQQDVVRNVLGHNYYSYFR